MIKADPRHYRAGSRAVVAVIALTIFDAALVKPSAAQAVRDDFAGPGFSADILYPCRRDENVLAIVAVAGRDFNSAMLRVNPRKDIGAVDSTSSQGGCRQGPGAHYRREADDERAELWEAQGIRLRFGTEVWYRFSMYIDPTIPQTDDNRLVIGEWKEDGGHSPMVAQRFRNRHFTITIEQDDDNPSRTKVDDDCRISIAHDDSPPASGPIDPPEETGPRLAAFPLQDHVPKASLGHDQRGAEDPAAAGSNACSRDIKITSFRNLPDVFGRWTDMMYHLKASVHGDGILQVWANGLPIVSVTGRIGFRDHSTGRQYFKFGPYRDHVAYSTYAMLAKFARGPSRADVDR